jgi:hypothetical protein
MAERRIINFVCMDGSVAVVEAEWPKFDNQIHEFLCEHANSVWGNLFEFERVTPEVMRIRVFTHAYPLRLKLVPKRQIGGDRKENELELCIPSIRGVIISHNWKEESNPDAPWHTQMWAVDAVSRRTPGVCSVASDVPARNDKQESIAQDILEAPRDLALRLGLKPYAEFEKKMSPLFARIASDERQQFLRNIYRCAAEKVLMERSRADAENLAREFEQAAEKMQPATPDIETASQNLTKAGDALAHGFAELERLVIERIVSQSQNVNRGVEDKRQQLVRHAGALRNLTGKEITVMKACSCDAQDVFGLRKIGEVAPDLLSAEEELGGCMRSLLGPIATAQYRYRFPRGRKPTASDHWLISAIAKCLPKAPPGRRSRFNRDKVICMTFEAALGETLRAPEGIKTARWRKSGL